MFQPNRENMIVKNGFIFPEISRENQHMFELPCHRVVIFWRSKVWEKNTFGSTTLGVYIHPTPQKGRNHHIKPCQRYPLRLQKNTFPTWKVRQIILTTVYFMCADLWREGLLFIRKSIWTLQKKTCSIHNCYFHEKIAAHEQWSKPSTWHSIESWFVNRDPSNLVGDFNPSEIY